MKIENKEWLEMKRTAKEFNKLANDLIIKLIIGYKKPILSIANAISNEKNLRIEPIDSSLKEKFIVYFVELHFGILSLWCYLNIEIMNIISFDTEININKRIINITRELSTVPKDILLTHFLGCVSQLIKQAKEKKSHRNALK